MATRAVLRTNARARADQDSSTFPTDAQYNMYLDKAGSRVWRQLVRLGWKPDSTTVTIAATGAAAYPLEGNQVGDGIVLNIQYVHRVDGQTRYAIPRVKEEERAALQSRTGDATRYDLIGGALSVMEIELYPIPSTGTYEVRYTKGFPGFTADSDVWFGPEGTDELIELDAAIQGTLKENGDASDLRKQLDATWDEVIQSIGWLDSNNPGTVRDARHKGLRFLDTFDWDWQVDAVY
jgi:hypothetical protein